MFFFFFCQAEDGIRDRDVTGVQTCALPISHYWIKRGEIIWSEKWTQEQINVGRHYEQARRRSFYAPIEQQYDRGQLSFWSWLKNIFKSK